MSRILTADERAQRDLIRRTMPSADDAAWVRERKTKLRGQRREPAPAPDGPCCARCAHWRAPGKSDDFGECRKAVVVTRRYGRLEPGTAMTLDEAAKRHGLEFAMLRVKGWFAGCSQYEDAPPTAGSGSEGSA